MDDLTPGIAPTLTGLRTVLALQRHTEWVSQPKPKGVLDGMRSGGFEPVGDLLRPKRTGGQAYVAMRGTQMVVAFRGSGGSDTAETALNALTDLSAAQLRPRDMLSISQASGAKVHFGFCHLYNRFRKDIRRAVENHAHTELYVTGFSLGSALASLAALDLAINLDEAPTLVGFGTPRVGNPEHVDFHEQQVPSSLRVVLKADPVARVPLDIRGALKYEHLGGLLELEPDGSPLRSADIDGNPALAIDTHQAHDRDAYHRAVLGLIAAVESRPELLTPGTLKANAKAERASARAAF